MKKGINIWSFEEGMPVIKCIKLAKDEGFDGIELALGENGEISLESSEKSILEVKNAANETGIEIHSLARL